MSKPIRTDRGANRVINRVVRSCGRHRLAPTYWTWTVTLPSGATRTLDLPMGEATHLERRGLAIQPA